MATIRDVANLCGVSTATVSHVLNGRMDRVGPETRERVLAAVRQLRYRPPALEDRQKAILTRNIGVMAMDLTKSPLLSHGYFLGMLDGILEVAMFRGWSTTIFVENMWGDVGLAVRRSYDGRCDGLIVVAPPTDSEIVRSVRERGTPVVLAGTTASIEGVSSVDIDGIAAGSAAARHLLDLGHRRFAYIGSTETNGASIERSAGFRSALREAGIPEDHIYAFSEANKRKPEALVQDLLAIPLAKRPTGVFCWHDGSAANLIGALSDAGVMVPDDFSVIGVDDAPEAESSIPPLTTFRQVVPVIGRRAANMLIDRAEDHSLPDEIVRFQPELVIRESTAPPRGVPNAGRVWAT